ncbi:hypothetical protein XYCOK13_22960 [Xylanibacillus composti]|uniref:GP-PDE domain-containing protein n=2 Tax=Xylanibacillus composti TaxID=1572762 RepID=A0A8J4M303_9BACL|nr:hypothetical protein XYCOK13_22960 [Xylanibacillus composti]
MPGLLKPAVENTLEAIDNAAHLKFEMVELDLKLTSDNQLVLMHDYTAGRVLPRLDPSYDGLAWDPVSAMLSNGYQPQLHDDWQTMHMYNSLIKDRSYMELHTPAKPLVLFDRNGNEELATIMGTTVRGEFIQTTQQVHTLKTALEYIGDNYPGMTVVLDLRHFEEVVEALHVIDQVSDCRNIPAKDWVILKPFANVFKGGWYNWAHRNPAFPHDESVVGKLGPIAYDYKWIPAISGRQITGNAPGSPPSIPGAPGPDVSQITGDVLQYVVDWLRELGGAVVTIELGIGDYATSPSNIQLAYDYATTYTTTMQAWRPPDMMADQQVTDPGKCLEKVNGNCVREATIIGFNWKDDGLGVYPIHKELYRTYEDVRKTAGIITADSVMEVLRSETFSRPIVQAAISRPYDSMFGDTTLTGVVDNRMYKLLNLGSGKALDVDNAGVLNRSNVQLWRDNGSGAQEWVFVPDSAGTYGLQNTNSGKYLDVADGGTANRTNVQIYERNFSGAQQWKVEYDPLHRAYKIWNPQSGKALDAAGGGMSDGTNVQIYSSNDTLAQRWLLIPVDHYAVYNIRSSSYLHADGYISDGTNVNVTNNPQYMWKPIRRGDGSYSLIGMGRGVPHMLTPVGSNDFDNVELYAENYADNQNWWLFTDEEGVTSLINKQSGKALDTYGNAAGANVIIHTPNGEPAQQWIFHQ